MTQSLMLPFISKLATLAPHVVIELHPSTSQPEKHLENGMFDFSIGVGPIAEGAFSSTPFGSLLPVIHARKSHPLTLKRSVSIEDCLTHKFVDLVIDNHAKLRVINPAKAYFTERGIELETTVKCGQLGLLAEVMKNSDHLLIGASCLLDSDNLRGDFEIVYVFEEKYGVELCLCDHQRTHSSDAHKWIKGVLLDSLKETINRAKY